jgi:hypothetical protein
MEEPRAKDGKPELATSNQLTGRTESVFAGRLETSTEGRIISICPIVFRDKFCQQFDTMSDRH